MRARWRLPRPAVQVIVGVCLCAAALAGCGGPALDEYDPAEVAYLRAQAEQHGGVVDEAVLVQTLEFREDCRTMKAYLNALARGPVAESDPAWQAFAEVPRRFDERGMSFMSEFLRGVVAAADRGDLQPAIDFLSGNCQDPPGAPGGIDGVGR